MAIQSQLPPPVSDRFGLLPEHRGRFGSFTVSLGANLLLGGLFLWIAISQLHREPPIPHYESTQLVFPTPPEPPPQLPPVPKIKAPPTPAPMVESPRKIEMPKPVVEPPKPEVARMNTPAMPAIPAPAAKAVVAPQPKVGLFASPQTVTAVNTQAKPTVQAGGFGDPKGVAVNPNASRPANVVSVGSFNAATGASQGSGTARPAVVQGTGFGSGVASGASGGTSNARVATAGFGATGFGAAGTTPAKTPATNFVAPEVISEPRPQYTEEARQLKIQGEVTLEVKFRADGKVEVLRVVNRLGHGLDEQAEQVARQIRFKPAAKDGQPVDHITYIHVLFQLA